MVRKVLMIHFSVFYTWGKKKKNRRVEMQYLFMNEVYPLGETVN